VSVPRGTLSDLLLELRIAVVRYKAQRASGSNAVVRWTRVHQLQAERRPEVAARMDMKRLQRCKNV
jgi:hypothetical protein